MYSHPNVDARQKERWLEGIAAANEVQLNYIDNKVRKRAYNSGLYHGACYGIATGAILAIGYFMVA